MTDSAEGLAALVTSELEGLLTDCRVHAGQVTAVVRKESLRTACVRLRDRAEFAFGQLVDLCGVDYLHYGESDWQTSETATGSGFSRGVEQRTYKGEASQPARFAVAYQLLSHRHNRRLRLRAFVDGDPPRIDTVTDIWSSANWFEREAFDLFGILFEGHPDLRRLLTDYGFIGHPFRKDFPLIGEVEVRYDPDKGRVVYEPVTIEPRTLVPKVIRHDARYAAEDLGKAAAQSAEHSGNGDA